jgi:hypothetical protein
MSAVDIFKNIKQFMDIKGIIIKIIGQTFVQFIAFGLFRYFKEQWKHHFRDYQDTNIIGWNIFEHNKSTNKVKFFMPSEETFSLSDLMHDDPVLHDKVMDAARTITPNYPSFMIINEIDVQSEFMRRLRNKVSESIKGSLWPEFALSKIQDKKCKNEPVLMLATCEKDEGVVTHTTRTWLIFPSELRWLLQFTEEEINDPNGIFEVEQPHWRIRILNLRKWAQAQYVDNEKYDLNAFASKSVVLPCQM